ncbi:MAG: hypothetical protein M1510_00960 [Nitrospirae bacterium]|nr:hypothetical protein [Nitrospirota bacterium]
MKGEDVSEFNEKRLKFPLKMLFGKPDGLPEAESPFLVREFYDGWRCALT